MNKREYTRLRNLLEQFVEDHELSRGADNHIEDAAWIVERQEKIKRQPYCEACGWDGDELGSRVLEGGKSVACCPECGEYERVVSLP